MCYNLYLVWVVSAGVSSYLYITRSPLCQWEGEERQIISLPPVIETIQTSQDASSILNSSDYKTFIDRLTLIQTVLRFLKLMFHFSLTLWTVITFQITGFNLLVQVWSGVKLVHFSTEIQVFARISLPASIWVTGGPGTREDNVGLRWKWGW